MSDVQQLKDRVNAEVDRRAAMLLDASHQIHAHPELNYEEHFAHDLLTSILADEGLETERGALDVPTAFRAITPAMPGGPTIAVLCEYDALPELGHACGHNIIATAGLGAGLAAATVAAELGGRVLIMGTPAEEGGGGKCKLAERGAFDGIAAAMMVHPADADLVAMQVIAIHELWVDYEGAAAHAAAFPWKGHNALDAAVLGYMNVAALRQHIRPDERVHGIFTRAGDKPNIVPSHTSANYYVRSPTLATLQPLKQRVGACLESGAAASGCSCHIRWAEYPYADMLDNSAMIESFVANAAAVGRTMANPSPNLQVVGSTDMGNVSYLAPSIHPMLAVAPRGVSIHTPEFARYAGAEEGDRAVIDGAKALAGTIVDLLASADLRTRATAEHATTLQLIGAAALSTR
jgi:amidohydrolase